MSTTMLCHYGVAEVRTLWRTLWRTKRATSGSAREAVLSGERVAFVLLAPTSVRRRRVVSWIVGWGIQHVVAACTVVRDNTPAPTATRLTGVPGAQRSRVDAAEAISALAATALDQRRNAPDRSTRGNCCVWIAWKLVREACSEYGFSVDGSYAHASHEPTPPFNRRWEHRRRNGGSRGRGRRNGAGRGGRRRWGDWCGIRRIAAVAVLARVPAAPDRGGPLGHRFEPVAPAHNTGTTDTRRTPTQLDDSIHDRTAWR